MKSAFECFQHAAKCEEQAKQATSEAGRVALLETAKHWRTLGEQAKVKEANEPRERRPQMERPRVRRATKLRRDS